MTFDDTHPHIAVLHGAGYVGGELIRLLHAHPLVHLGGVTSRTFAGEPVHVAHPALRGQVDLSFTAPADLDLTSTDVLVIAAEHGQSMHLVPEVLASGYEGPIVDLSADFRLNDAETYAEWYDEDHAAPDLLDQFAYGLPEQFPSNVAAAKHVANPGCYATGLSLAIAPLAAQGQPLDLHVTACTGASGSGATPSAATHFPDRDGNVRAYSVLGHRHLAEVSQVVGPDVDVSFVPVSGPWTRGIWGTVQCRWPEPLSLDAVTHWYADAYADASCVRLSPGVLPELRPVAGTPFVDLGWQTDGRRLVVGFALDNLLKGAASQAVQNLNRILGFPDAAGLLPGHATPAGVAGNGCPGHSQSPFGRGLP